MLGWILNSGKQSKYETFPHGLYDPFNFHNIFVKQEYHYFRTENIEVSKIK